MPTELTEIGCTIIHPKKNLILIFPLAGIRSTWYLFLRSDEMVSAPFLKPEIFLKSPDNPNDNYTFSGRRAPTKYIGQGRKIGFRGIYRTKDGTYTNADLNSSANIGRKAFSELFTANSVDFYNVKFYKHPDTAV